MAGMNGWRAWLACMGGLHGWYEWLACMAGMHGWHACSAGMQYGMMSSVNL